MQPNSLLTDSAIDALVKIRELAAPDPVRDRDVIETALLRYVAFIMAERERVRLNYTCNAHKVEGLP